VIARLPILTRKKVPKPDDPPPAPPVDGTDEEEEARYKPLDAKLARRMAGLLAPYKWQYAGGLAVGLGHVLLELLSPRFTQAIIDHCSAWLVRSPRAAADPAYAAEPPDVSFLARWAAGLAEAVGFGPPMATSRGAIATIVAIVLLWALVAAASVALQRLTILITTAAGERVQFEIRRRIFAHLQALSMSYFDRTKLGRIISRCTSDIGSLREINVWGVYTIGSNLVMMLFAAGMLLATDVRLFAAVAPLGVVLFLINGAYLRRASGMWQVAREGYTKVAANMAENITGMRVVTAFNRQQENLGAFNVLQEANTANNVRASRLNAVYLPLLDLCGFVGK
jgi:ABC-type multidrug transport system fused ATPase/permease subunit